ncbi:MAG TPA: signal peptidase II [Candidatus Baltobacteraceae bacterium]
METNRPILKANSAAFNRIASTLAFVAIADLGIKRFIASTMSADAVITIIPHWLWIRYIQNDHGAMGMFGTNQGLLIVLAGAVLVGLGFMLREAIAHSALAQIAFGMIAGGAIGNLVDRIAHHYVIDYISVGTFYIFNFADACISVGTGLLIIDALTRGRARA